ncbi:hypothetical protein AVEN_458-1 [Araneus ventricosus]|uniref:Uncharacterized protein n=1 Tax=Araneus ventricosus TaxID=182803 RepID=A0A4Y2T9U1_ARAVE|nr:hypothetical protein AVEN_113323-1 [Araneus ventricosus]GBN97404.1 hypothetical protein AVEN_458-1 [Araneus ventricosus]
MSVTGWTLSEKLSDETPRSSCNILFGRTASTPSSLNENCNKKRWKSLQTSDRERNKLFRERKKTRYDCGATDHHFKDGDLVWVYNPKLRGLIPKPRQN